MNFNDPYKLKTKSPIKVTEDGISNSNKDLQLLNT